MGKLLATRMRSRRKELGLSQVELASGICEQGQISKIERDIDYSPGADVVYALAKKLNVTMDYFFDEEIHVESDFLTQFRSVSKKFLERRDFESLKYIYELETAKMVKLPLSDQLYLQWIKAIVLFNYDHKQDEAIKKLETILSKYSEYDWEYLNISNSLLHFYFKTANNSKLEEVYSHMTSLFKSVKARTIEQLEILIKCRYNFCRYLWLNKQAERAISETLETIDICLKNNSFYCLANLYCLLGNVSEDFSRTDKVKEYFVTAQNIYQLERNDKMALEIERFISETFQ
ncbi:TPA: helix-turn-helix transcriptional regulator [Streptococcus suis]|nr:helix-turn-helix transcriptional regulator [Streptococcus suis]HEM5489911.1 helix-turn-helix transcriptional regulator [Streptococcus suis]